MAVAKTYLDYNGLARYDGAIKSYINSSVQRANDSIALIQTSLGLPSETAPGHIATGVYKYINDSDASINASINKIRTKIGLDANLEDSRLASKTLLGYIDGIKVDTDASITNLSTWANSLEERLGWPSTSNGARRYGIYKELEDREEVIAATFARFRDLIGVDENLEDERLVNTNILDYIDSKNYNASAYASSISTNLSTHIASANANNTSIANAISELNTSINNLSTNFNDKLSQHIDSNISYNSSTFTHFTTEDQHIMNNLTNLSNNMDASFADVSRLLDSLELRVGWPSTSSGADRYGIYKELEDREEVIAALFTKLANVLGLDSSMEDSRLQDTNMLDYIDNVHNMAAARPQSSNSTVNLYSAAYDLTERLDDLEARINDIITVGKDGFYFKAPTGEFIMSIKEDGIHVKNIFVENELNLNL